MSPTLPTLDDRRFDDLVQEAFRIIGSGDGAWTNRNPSDPGITIVELLAFVTEMLIYRVDQITDDDRRAFARLLAPDSDPLLSPEAQLSQAVRQARKSERLVSCADYERAAVDVDPESIARAHCIPDRDLTRDTEAARSALRPGHLTVLIVPRSAAGVGLAEAVAEQLDARRLLTTRVHVGIPEPVEIGVRLAVRPAQGTLPSAVGRNVVDALTAFLDPVAGRKGGDGWRAGQWVYVSDIYRRVDQVPGVDYVSAIVEQASGLPRDEILLRNRGSLVRDPRTGRVEAVRIESHQIVRPHDEGHIVQVLSADPAREGER